MFIFKRFPAIFILIAGLFSAPAMASIFSYITESTGTPTNATYTYVIERWDPENSGMLNPCYGDRVCYVTVNHKHDIDGSGGRRTLLLVELKNYVL